MSSTTVFVGLFMLGLGWLIGLLSQRQREPSTDNWFERSIEELEPKEFIYFSLGKGLNDDDDDGENEPIDQPISDTFRMN